MDSMTINIILLILMVGGALATTVSSNLLRAAIALASTSGSLSVLMFRLNAPLAAVFELSVCAGLIPAIFISAIGLTKRMTPEGEQSAHKARLKTLWLLPVIVILVGSAMSQVTVPEVALPAVEASGGVREVLWNIRHIDLIGQIVILLGGAFGVAVLLKEVKRG